MDNILVSQVNDVYLQKPDRTLIGTLHLTAHQLIFSHPKEENWITYSMLSSVESLPVNDEGQYPLEIRCHHFLFFTLAFPTRKAVYEVFETIRRSTCLNDPSKLHAFHFTPQENFAFSREEGWRFYDAEKEFRRLGVETKSDQWRFTNLNKNYDFCPTYPSVLVVPKKFNDTALGYARKYRSKGRLPVLSYLHNNMASITRSSQPLLGVKRNRSVQDEGLLQSIFSTTATATDNLIVDARPAANAYANQAMGMGTENMEFYPNCTREFMGIENIHVVRDSLSKLVEAICSPGGQGVISKIQLSRSNWLKHIRSILEGVQKIVYHVHELNSHVLVHCSDGWDRTAQLTAVSEICLDPFYRTIRGIATLIEKEFVSFGFKFRSRCGHLCKDKAFVDNSLVALNHTANPSLLSNMQNRFLQYASARPGQDKETCPIFHQFLDCIYQLWIQNPTEFEFNEKFLLFLYEQVYACQYGTFLFDCEREMRAHANLTTKTFSIWSYVFSNIDSFLNPIYSSPEPDAPRQMLKLETKYLRYWSSLFCRRDEDLNCLPPSPLYSPSNSSGPQESEGLAASIKMAASSFLTNNSTTSQSSSSINLFDKVSDNVNVSTEFQSSAKPLEKPVSKSKMSPLPSPARTPKEKTAKEGKCSSPGLASSVSLTSSPKSASSKIPSRSSSISSSQSVPASHTYDISLLSHPLESFAQK